MQICRSQLSFQEAVMQLRHPVNIFKMANDPLSVAKHELRIPYSRHAESWLQITRMSSKWMCSQCLSKVLKTPATQGFINIQHWILRDCWSFAGQIVTGKFRAVMPFSVTVSNIWRSLYVHMCTPQNAKTQPYPECAFTWRTPQCPRLNHQSMQPCTLRARANKAKIQVTPWKL